MLNSKLNIPDIEHSTYDGGHTERPRRASDIWLRAREKIGNIQ